MRCAQPLRRRPFRFQRGSARDAEAWRGRHGTGGWTRWTFRPPSASRCSPSRALQVCAVFKDLRQRIRCLAGVAAQHARRADAGHRDGLAGSARAAARMRASAAAEPGMDAYRLVRSARIPPLLNCIVDPPPVLWARGEAAVLGPPAVAIVGSRAGPPYALDVAGRLAGELAGARAWSSSAGWRGVSTRQLIGARSRLAGRRSRCSVPASTASIQPEHASLAEDD